uniref:hypothetical protein n=1 Tax=Flavobacterium sp. TaxID=239 RepID=UPI00404A1710
MQTNFLFPNRLKLIGWLLFIPSFIFGIVCRILEIEIDNYLNMKVFAIYKTGFSENVFLDFMENGVLDEIVLICLIVGGILIGFSRLKVEDEYIAKIRYESLVWATYFNFGFLLFSTLFIFGIVFYEIMILNIFSMLFFFIIRFHYMIYKLQKSGKDDQ